MHCYIIDLIRFLFLLSVEAAVNFPRSAAFSKFLKLMCLYFHPFLGASWFLFWFPLWPTVHPEAMYYASTYLLIFFFIISSQLHCIVVKTDTWWCQFFFKKFLRLVLWPIMWSTLAEVTYTDEKNVYCAAVDWRLCRYQLDSFDQ